MYACIYHPVDLFVYFYPITTGTMTAFTPTGKSWKMFKVGHCPTEPSLVTSQEECNKAGQFLGLNLKARTDPTLEVPNSYPKGCYYKRSMNFLWFNSNGIQFSNDVDRVSICRNGLSSSTKRDRYHILFSVDDQVVYL